MPTCKNCSKHFPYKVTIDKKQYDLGTRSYCLECSPFGSKNGYELRKKKNSKPDEKTCPICYKSFSYTKNNVCSSCRNFHNRFIKKIKCIEYKGGKCIQCGITDPDMLAFHHRNEDDKSFIISWNRQKTWDKLKLELDKCDLLCMNCHTKLHRLEINEKEKKILDYYKNNKKINQYF